MKKKIGFVGLGVMGKPMATNLVNAGYTLGVCDINPDATRELGEKGAKIFGRLRELAQWSDVVMTMLPDVPEVEHVYLSNDGLLKEATAGTIFIDSSTVNPEVTKMIGEEAARKGVNMLDAPVGGGQANAIAGNLIMLVGGEAEVLEEVRDILETVGEKVLHAGPLGSGEGLKLANNLTTAILGCMLAEGFEFAERIGLDKEKLYELLSGNVPRLVPILSRKIVDGDFQPGFMTRLMNKDLRLILGLAETHEIPLPFGAVAKQMYQFVQNKGLREKDFTSVATLYKEEQTQ